MRVLIQRVLEAAVTVGGEVVSRIGPGLLVLVGVEEADGGADGAGDADDMEWLCGKIARLRVFDDWEGVMNLDVMQTGGEILAISQFTLHASTRKGNRPSYIRAARPEIAQPLYDKFTVRLAREIGREVKTGIFGADMKVALVNDGPVTILIDSRNRE